MALATDRRTRRALGDRGRRGGSSPRLATARWPGRLELLDGSRVGVGRVLLDGAHNPAGAAALATSLADLGVRRPTIVFGAMRAKGSPPSSARSLGLSPDSSSPRSTIPAPSHPASLARAWRRVSGRRAATAPTAAQALAIADGDPVVVAGSLYLVGAVRGMITGTTEEGWNRDAAGMGSGRTSWASST